METVIEKEEDISRKISSKVTERNSFKIFGISIWRLFAYFISLDFSSVNLYIAVYVLTGEKINSDLKSVLQPHRMRDYI